MSVVLPARYCDAPTFSFGDSPQMADSGARDVINRKQVATCGAYEILRRDDEVMPREGQVEIVLDGSGDPVCAIESWKVDIKRYDEIDEQFARDEACTDLAEWQAIHEAYFRRKRCFSPDMKIVRQYFRVVEVFPPYDGGQSPERAG